MKRNPTAKLMALGRNSVNVAACPSVVRELLRITPSNTSEVRHSVKEVTDIGQENMLDKGYTHG